MPRDRVSGAAGNDFGRTTAPLIAGALGASRTSGPGNEFRLGGRLVAIKCARRATSSVGVSYRMLERLDTVLGAFEEDDGLFSVYELSPADFKAHMRPTRSQGASAGKVALVAKSVFLTKGRHVDRVRLPQTRPSPTAEERPPCP